MPTDQERYERALAHAENTLVADLVDHQGEPAGTIVLAHPGQTLNRDTKFLRENFGIHPGQVITLAESKERPMSPEDKAAEAAADPNVAWVDDKAVERAARGARNTAKGGADNTAKAGPGAVTADKE